MIVYVSLGNTIAYFVVCVSCCLRHSIEILSNRAHPAIQIIRVVRALAGLIDPGIDSAQRIKMSRLTGRGRETRIDSLDKTSKPVIDELGFVAARIDYGDLAAYIVVEELGLMLQ